MSQIWYRPPCSEETVQGSRVKNQTCPMRLQGLRSVDQYFTGLSGLPHYAALGPGSSGSCSCSSTFFAFSAIFPSSWPSLCFLTAVWFCTGSTRGRDISPRLYIRVHSNQPDEVGKPQISCTQLNRTVSPHPCCLLALKAPRRTGHLSHPWHSRPSHGRSGAFH